MQVVDDLASMGFTKDEIRAVMRKLTESGQVRWRGGWVGLRVVEWMWAGAWPSRPVSLASGSRDGKGCVVPMCCETCLRRWSLHSVVTAAHTQRPPALASSPSPPALQPVDLNVVIDKLMNGEGAAANAARRGGTWFSANQR